MANHEEDFICDQFNCKSDMTDGT